MFWSVERRIIDLTTLYFIGLFIFLKKKLLCNLYTKRVNEKDFYSRYARILFPNLFLLYHLLHRNSIQSDICTNYFCTPLFEVRTYNTYELHVNCPRDEGFPTTTFLLDQPLCSLWYKMFVLYRIHHQRLKRTGAGEIFARRTDNHNYGQDRDERHSGSYHYNSNCVRMFDSIGIIELYDSQNRALDGLEKATRKIYGGRSREIDTMKIRCRRPKSRGSVSTTTTTTTMITTCAANQAKSLLHDMKDNLPDLILTTEVLNLLLRWYSNCLGPPLTGKEGGG